MNMTPDKIVSKFESLKSDRATWETHWQECYDYMLPRKRDVIIQTQPGEKKNTHLFDNTAMQSAIVLASSLHGMLTSPNTIWFGLSTGIRELDDNDRVRRWLQESSKIIFDILNASNFNTEVHELYIDLVIPGTAIFGVEEDDEEIVRFSTRPIGNCVIEENHLGMVDSLYRCYKWTASQIYQKWGEKPEYPDELKKAYEDGDSKKFEIIQGVYKENTKAGIETHPYASKHVLRAYKFELETKSFRSFPFMVPRFSKIAGEMYGRSPGMAALPDAKTLNKMDETVLIGAEKVVDPPLQLPDDGFIMPVMTVPGGLNYYRPGSNDRIEPVFNDARIDFGFQAMSERRDRVRKAFFIDQLQLYQGSAQTATEVMQRTEESMRVLAPLLGRLRHEFLTPLMGRIMEIGQLRNIFPKIPNELAGRVLQVNYSSLIARAQKVQEGQNILRMVETLSPFASADPSVLDLVDGDEAARVISRIYDIPQQILRDKDQIAEIRKQRAQAQQQAAQLEQQRAETESMKNMAPILKAVKE